MISSNYKNLQEDSDLTTTNDNVRTPKIGDIYMMKFTGSGSEQTGWRPGLIFQNNTGNEFSPNVIVLPLTSAIKKTYQPTHVVLHADDTGLKMDSIVLCENPQRLSKERLGNYLTTLSNDYMTQVASASILATSAISFLDLRTLASLWEQANRLNAFDKSA